MPVRLPSTQPPDSHAVIAGYLRKLLASPTLAASFRDLTPAALTTTEGFRVYSLDHEASQQPRPLSSAVTHKWRYLLREGDQTVAEIDVVAEGDERRPRVVAVHHGPRAAAMNRALEVAEALESVREHDFELRGLEAPALHFVAIWLHRGEDDLVIPVEPNRTSLANYRPYTEAEIHAALEVHSAAARATQEANPGPSGG